MPTLTPRALRFGLSALIVLVVGGLMYARVVSPDAGLAVIIGVAAGVGIYQTADRAGRGGGGS